VALAINKKALVDHVMNGFAVPADQMYPQTVTGSDPALKGPGHNLEEAKRLLKEAGYPDGFEVTFDTTNDDFANDEEIAQAVASQLAKIGIRVKVNAAPKKIIYSLQGSQETSFGTSYWTSSMGDAIRFLDNCAHSNSKEKGLGRWNIGGYADQEVDTLIERSGESVDQKLREEAMQNAQQIFLGRDQGFIPLYFPVNIYGVNTELNFSPSATAHLVYGRMSWAK
jgi:peptide/nickel transport system substrate-binding protein